MTSKIQEVENRLFSTDLRSLSAPELMTLSRKIMPFEAEIQTNNPQLIRKRIAVIGTANVQFFCAVLRPFLYAHGLAPSLFEGAYSGMESEIRDQTSAFYAFQPEVVIALTNYRDLHQYPNLLASAETAETLADAYADSTILTWEKVHQRTGAQIYLTNFAVPNLHLLGSQEANLPASPDQFIRLVNSRMLTRKPPFLQFIDQEALASDFGKDRWFDNSAWFISKQAAALSALPEFCYAAARQLAAGSGKIKKCLAVDLDNTLWGGVVGDDGLEGINLDPNNAVGEAFLDFQKTLKKLRERGILLAVCSKNEPEVAESVFDHHPGMLLKRADFAAFAANWNDKAANLRLIAKSLNIGVDALVFFDDNPAERELVKKTLPMVEVINVPEDPADFSLALTRARCFDWEQFTAEDLSRTESILADQDRAALNAQLDYPAYLRALQMRVEIGAAQPAELTRITQLINKTNQFNLRTKRYSEAEITETAQDSNRALIRVSLTDKFSQYGIISALILSRDSAENTLFIDTWVMSCRVFQRRLEYRTMNWLVDFARSRQVPLLMAEYIPSERNKLTAELYEELGFELISEEFGIKKYRLDVKRYNPFETWFEEESENGQSPKITRPDA